MARKKTERKAKSFAEAVGLRFLLQSEVTDFFLGLIMLLVSLLVATAMVSYLSTGRADQSVLEHMRPGEWLGMGYQWANYCGAWGAITAYYLVAVNFGFAALLIPLFFILVALRLMRVYVVNLWKWFLCLSVTMVWSSVFMAKFVTPLAGSLVFNPGGGHGLLCVQRIEGVVGAPGLVALLLVTATALLAYLSAQTIEVVRRVLNPAKYLAQRVKVTVDEPRGDDEATSYANAEPEQPTQQDDTDADAPAPVVDVTNLQQFERPEGAKITAAADSAGQPTVAVVEPVTEAKKADGSTAPDAPDLSKPINPWEPFTHYHFPQCDLLRRYDSRPVIDMDEIKANNAQIVKVLNSFGVSISRINATVGPTVTLYEITPSEGVRINKIRGLEDDIALSLSALGIRIIAPIPGKGTIGIEVPNKKPQIVSMESVLNTRKFQNTHMALPMALGKTITNEVFMVDLAKIPHLLVAGATGQGKSVGLNAIITSLLYKKHPNELKFVLVDPKKVEFSVYNKIAPHYMAALPENEEEPIITDVQRVVRTLNSLCALMDHRYDLLKMAQVKKIDEYNQKWVSHRLSPNDGHGYMPYIVVIIDEFGDLIMTAGKEVELPIARIAQLARAVGMHMIIATQRPTTKIITGNIKANFPGRMAFRVTSQIDSRTILDRKGAEQLVGKGDMLFLSGGEPVRVQCAFIDTPEIESVNDHIERQPGPIAPLELPEPPSETDGQDGGDGFAAGGGGTLDQLFDEAARAIVLTQQGSTSMIQRRYSIGYNRAGRLMDQLEKAGIVGQAQGSKPRDVLITDEVSLNQRLAQIHGS